MLKASNRSIADPQVLNPVAMVGVQHPMWKWFFLEGNLKKSRRAKKEIPNNLLLFKFRAPFGRGGGVALERLQIYGVSSYGSTWQLPRSSSSSGPSAIQRGSIVGKLGIGSIAYGIAVCDCCDATSSKSDLWSAASIYRYRWVPPPPSLVQSPLVSPWSGLWNKGGGISTFNVNYAMVKMLRPV